MEGGCGLMNSQVRWWQVGEAVTCPEVKGPPFATPHPAPGVMTYPYDNLMGCGSTVGRRLEGHLSSEMYKFQHRALLSSREGCRLPRAAGSGQHQGTQTGRSPARGRWEAGDDSGPDSAGAATGDMKGVLWDLLASRSHSALPLRMFQNAP